MFRRFRFLLVLAAVMGGVQARAQIPGAGGPVPVGIIRAEKQPVTETSAFVGRIQAINRVSLVARVTAFLEQEKFTEGAEVRKGDLLYLLEQPPFQADLDAKTAAVRQAQAQLENATLTFKRQEQLLKTPAGQQAAYDAAKDTMLADAAQVLSAKAQQEQSRINLGYTEIRSPIDGKIGRTSVTIGNVVSPTSGTLTTITSEDPMYVVFPVPVVTALDLRQRLGERAGFNGMVIRVRLPDGRMYDQTGKVDFVDNSISATTDTLILRGTIPNPKLPSGDRELVDNEFVHVLLQGAEPVSLLTIPQAAILSDQRGDYVYAVDGQNKVVEKRITVGQSNPSTATVLSGLEQGEMVILDGIQKVRPGQVVSPGPASPLPGAKQAAADSTISVAVSR
ncbi:MAG: efflux RND transporter periplasmic adaptor subunit [Acetobacteraceae bacterium]|nr:efflux RND transporter periplasmic adaptor subunit [Acetobacteraceae bacterium]